MIKNKIWDRSSTSIENAQEDKFWEVLNKSKASSRNFREDSNPTPAPTRQASLLSDYSTGPRPSCFKGHRDNKMMVRGNSERDVESQELEPIVAQTVSNICDSSANVSSSPSD